MPIEAPPISVDEAPADKPPPDADESTTPEVAR